MVIRPKKDFIQFGTVYFLVGNGQTRSRRIRSFSEERAESLVYGGKGGVFYRQHGTAEIQTQTRSLNDTKCSNITLTARDIYAFQV